MFSVVVHRCCRQQLVRHLLPVCRLPVQRFSTTIDDVWSKLKFLPMPQLSPTMHTGTIEQWHMRPGDVAEQYRLCVEVSATTLLKESDSTEKIHMDVEIMEDMHLAALLHRPGDTVDVGTPVAVFCDDEATVDQLRSLNMAAVAERFRVGDVARSALWQGYVKAEDKDRTACGCGCS